MESTVGQLKRLGAVGLFVWSWVIKDQYKEIHSGLKGAEISKAKFTLTK